MTDFAFTLLNQNLAVLQEIAKKLQDWIGHTPEFLSSD